MKVEQGQIVGGTVTGIQPYGAFIKMDNGIDGLVFISCKNKITRRKSKSWTKDKMYGKICRRKYWKSKFII